MSSSKTVQAVPDSSSGAAEAAQAHEEGFIQSMPRRRALPGRSAVVRGAEWLSYQLALLTTGLAFLLALAVIGCLLLQVFFRYALNSPLAWTDEAATFFFAWLMLLLASICVRERSHVRFTFIFNRLPHNVAAVLDGLIMVLIAAFGVALVITGRGIVDLVWNNLSPAVHYPLQTLYVAVPLQGILLVVHAVANLAIGSPASAGPPIKVDAP